MQETRTSIHFTLNGKLIELTGKEVFLPLSDTLRYYFNKTGTKVVCAEGDCGACTILISRMDKKLDFKSINTCIYPTYLVDGHHLISVEALSSGESISEIQDSMLRNFGAQCGFCTPGFIMSLTNMFEHKKNPSIQNIKNYLTGNLCRCTGYWPIIEAAQDVDTTKIKPVSKLFNYEKIHSNVLDEIQKAFRVQYKDKIIFAPKTIKDAVAIKKEHPEIRIIAGATDLGVQKNKGFDIGSIHMSLHLIEELCEIKKEQGEVWIGANVNLTEIQNFMEDTIPDFANFLNIFASPQIKNTATLIGNIANGSPIADTTPVLLCFDAIIEVMGLAGRRNICLSEFFVSYKKLDLKEDEIITGLKLKIPQPGNKIGIYKVSQRRDLDISCVNAAFNFEVEKNKIRKARISYGGVAGTPIRLLEIEKKLEGTAISKESLISLQKSIYSKIEPISDLRGSDNFRKNMAMNLIEKYFVEELKI